MTEREVKLAVATTSHIRHALASLGWQRSQSRHYERNWVFDTPDSRLMNSGYLLRLRQVERTFTLTVKEPGDSTAIHKVREEHETAVADGDEMRRILSALGYQPVWIYEKYRTRFDKPHEEGHIVLDETPIGDYLELEGESGWIDRAAAELGFGHDDYITASYRGLFEDYRRRHPNFGPHMIFPEGSSRPPSS